jgi:hypothetical protein
MAFGPISLSPNLVLELQEFVRVNVFADLYAAYHWKNDTYANGFPDILDLELRLAQSERTTGITLADVKAVAEWGAMRNRGRITGPEVVLPSSSLRTAQYLPLSELELMPTRPIASLQKSGISGIGPTYLSKVVRFGLPQEYGAIDTRCVRVFGKGDLTSSRHQWINLKTRNDGYGWFIPKFQSAWPGAYADWINILRFFVSVLQKDCPHPPEFADSRLRSRQTWACADVEMALFSYASRFVQ